MFEIKISSIGNAKSYRDTWATRSVGLVDPGEHIYTGNPYYHVEFFNDVSEDIPEFITPAKEHLLRVLEFSKSFNDSDKILVHCHAGVSRSPAISSGILFQHKMPAKNIFNHLENIRPNMYPNGLIIKLMDELLDGKGELINAFHEWEQKSKWSISKSGLIYKSS